jgi:hypothetical protein
MGNFLSRKNFAEGDTIPEVRVRSLPKAEAQRML